MMMGASNCELRSCQCLQSQRVRLHIIPKINHILHKIIIFSMKKNTSYCPVNIPYCPRNKLILSTQHPKLSLEHLNMSPIHISRSLFQDIEGGEDGEAGDPPFRVDQQTLRVWADGRPHRVNIPLKYQVCR